MQAALGDQWVVCAGILGAVQRGALLRRGDHALQQAERDERVVVFGVLRLVQGLSLVVGWHYLAQPAFGDEGVVAVWIQGRAQRSLLLEGRRQLAAVAVGDEAVVGVGVLGRVDGRNLVGRQLAGRNNRAAVASVHIAQRCKGVLRARLVGLIHGPLLRGRGQGVVNLQQRPGQVAGPLRLAVEAQGFAGGRQAVQADRGRHPEDRRGFVRCKCLW